MLLICCCFELIRTLIVLKETHSTGTKATKRNLSEIADESTVTWPSRYTDGDGAAKMVLVNQAIPKRCEHKVSHCYS